MHYSADFYKFQSGDSAKSAEIIVPLLMKLVKVESVVDVGCGVGGWLQKFREAGVEDVMGLDGSWVQRKDLQIPEEKFREADLENPPTLGRKFSLAVSVEVAEHLKPEAAEQFIDYLCGLAPVVAFSAAIPGQGGTNHINEQWQSYWAGLFRTRGMRAYDVVRPHIWDNHDTCFWYAQNLLVYGGPELIPSASSEDDVLLNVVHPRLFELSRRPENLPASTAIRAIPHSLKRGAKSLKNLLSN